MPARFPLDLTTRIALTLSARDSTVEDAPLASASAVMSKLAPRSTAAAVIATAFHVVTISSGTGTQPSSSSSSLEAASQGRVSRSCVLCGTGAPYSADAASTAHTV
jgi:hypothetical protein